MKPAAELKRATRKPHRPATKAEPRSLDDHLRRLEGKAEEAMAFLDRIADLLGAEELEDFDA